MNVELREVQDSDLRVLFEFQLDEDANQMALTHPRSAEVFDAHWNETLSDPNVTARVILVNESVAGIVSVFPSDDGHSLGYWLGRNFWGQGVATRSVQLLLAEACERPILARAAVSNKASLRVLQKCGFLIVRSEFSPGDDRYIECDELVLKLS